MTSDLLARLSALARTRVQQHPHRCICVACYEDPVRAVALATLAEAEKRAALSTHPDEWWDAFTSMRAELELTMTDSCGANSCVFGRPPGMGTNGPCMCFDALDRADSLRVRRAIAELRSELETLRARVANRDTVLYAIRDRLRESTEGRHSDQSLWDEVQSAMDDVEWVATESQSGAR